MSHAGEAVLTRPLNTDEARRMFEMKLEKTQVAVRDSTLMAISAIFAQQNITNVNSPWQCNTRPPFVMPLLQNAAPAPPCTVLTPSPLSSQLHPFTPLPTSGSAGSPVHINRRGVPVPSSTFGQPNTIPYPIVASVPREAPVPSRTIPRVPDGEGGWKMVVHDWENADSTRSLPVALKNWPPEWYSRSRTASKAVGSLYNQWKLIATEFIYTYALVCSPSSHLQN